MKPRQLVGRGAGDDPRARRDEQRGTPVAFPVVSKDGQIAVQVDPKGAIGTDPARGLNVRAGPGLAVQSASPFALHVVAGAGMMLQGGALAVVQSNSIVVNPSTGQLEATPTSAQVTDPDTGETAQQALERKANITVTDALDVRCDALEAGFGDFAHPGASEYEAWFAANCATHTAFNAQAFAANRLYGMPFFAARRTGAALDRLAINVTTGSAGHARLGIYADNNGYPGALVIDAGEVDVTSIAVVAATIAQALTPGGRYWEAYVSDATPTLRGLPVNSCSHALGTSSALGTAGNCGLYVAYAYAALPDPFPSTPTMITANPIPALFYRYSA